MGKIAVVYWSGTGNTETMANAVLEGAKGKGADAVLACESVICNEMPDDEGIQSCRTLGEMLAG